MLRGRTLPGLCSQFLLPKPSDSVSNIISMYNTDPFICGSTVSLYDRGYCSCILIVSPFTRISFLLKEENGTNFTCFPSSLFRKMNNVLIQYASPFVSAKKVLEGNLAFREAASVLSLQDRGGCS